MTQERQARPTRVLILDEDRVEGGMLAFHLRREGLVVMLMTSAEEAADAIAWAEPDVLLVEVAAQGFDGREFLGQLAHLPVDVYAVADRQLPAEVELDALRLGVIDIMMKPIDPVTLARRLKSRPERTRRGSMAGLPEGGISGDQAVHSVVHLLQMAHRHRLNARLHAEIAGDWAVLLVRHGEVIDAEAPSATGREAAYQMVRATQGAFVLFPLPSEAEELSRDDVIRADLATLVADAMGRREPRTVNVVKVREQETFVLPHVGSPRAPLAKRGNDETLEYAAETVLARAADGARVRRPGEREREQAEGAASAVRARVELPPPAKPLRQPTQPMMTVVTPPALPSTNGPSASELAMRVMDGRASIRADATRPITDQGVGTGGGGAVIAAESMQGGRGEGPFGGRSPIESPTVDEGFDESTDQVEVKRPRAVYIAQAKRPERVAPSAPITNGGLRRVAGAGAAPANLGAVRRPTDPEMAAIGPETHERRAEGGYDERTAGTTRFGPEERRAAEANYLDGPARGRRGSRARADGERRTSWSLPTMVMAGAAVVLALFVVARLATRETPVVTNIDADPNLKLGQALIDLDEGRRDAARSALATLAIDKDAPSEVLAALAKMHYQDRRLAEAQALLERLVERNPAEPEALAWLGLVQAERKDLPRAGANFSKALEGARGDLAERLKWLVPKEPPASAPATPTEGTAPRVDPGAAAAPPAAATGQ